MSENQMLHDNKRILPFLKWAGGKRWLVDRHPGIFDIEYRRFIEPFLGSGAVFFKLLPVCAILSDRNERLIETYESIRDEHAKVSAHLRRHHRLHSKEYYYHVRQCRPRSSAGRAAQLIYLNRTCWNGLYRVNRAGIFNVPIGTKENVLLETDDFHAIAQSLASVDLRACDFADSMSVAGTGDLVFVDPPYTVKHNNNGFIKYNEGLFSWEDQIRLRNAVLSASQRGANVVVTNACHPSLEKLYRGVGSITKLRRPSVIAASPKYRKRYDEMIVKCFRD